MKGLYKMFAFPNKEMIRLATLFQYIIHEVFV